jgi:hypothetical protein
MMPTKITLSPTESAYLVSSGVTAEEEQRFTAAIIDAWSSVPKGARTSIYAHFYDIPMATYPNVGLLPPPPPEWYLANANSPNYMLRVNSKIAFKFPGGDAWLRLAIIHELAHCFLIATEHPSHTKGATMSGMETAADTTLLHWGSDMTDYAMMVQWFIKFSEEMGAKRLS